MSSTGYRFPAHPYHLQVLSFEKLDLKERLKLLQVCRGLRRLVLQNGIFGRRIELFCGNSYRHFGIQLIGGEAEKSVLLAHRSALSSIRHVRRIELHIYQNDVYGLNPCLLGNLLHVDQLRLKLDETSLPTLDLGLRVSSVPIVELALSQEATTQTRAELNQFIRDRLADCRFLSFRGDDLGFADIRGAVSTWLPELRLLILDHTSRLLNSIEEILRDGLLTGDHQGKPVVLRQTFSKNTECPYFEMKCALEQYDQLEKILPNAELFDQVRHIWIDPENQISDVVKDYEELHIYRTTKHVQKALLFVVFDPRECLVIHPPESLLFMGCPDENAKNRRLARAEPVIARLPLRRGNY